jgi:hypothetical protein
VNEYDPIQQGRDGITLNARDDSRCHREPNGGARFARAAGGGVEACATISGVGVLRFSDVERHAARGAVNLVCEAFVASFDARHQRMEFLDELDAQVSDDE